jgi:hypothetical protein
MAQERDPFALYYWMMIPRYGCYVATKSRMRGDVQPDGASPPVLAHAPSHRAHAQGHVQHSCSHGHHAWSQY